MEETRMVLRDTPLGALQLEASSKGLTMVHFLEEDPPGFSPVLEGNSGRILEFTEAQLRAYFGNSLEEFDLPLDFIGTPFRLAVWGELQKIPFGQTRTYGELASAIGRPGGARAVGQANRSNPLAIIIPCHRVVAQGGLGGYAGSGPEGRRRKTWLLDHEGIPAQ